METRARFGYTAPVGTTDDGRFRRLTVHLPAEYAHCLFDARDAGASDQQMRQIIAEGFKDVYFQDGGSRAMGFRTSPSMTSITSISNSEKKEAHVTASAD